VWPRVLQPRSQEPRGASKGGWVQRGKRHSCRKALAFRFLLLFSEDLSASSLTLFKKKKRPRGNLEGLWGDCPI